MRTIIILLALAVLSPYPVEGRYILQPWHVTKVNVWSPSPHPGSSWICTNSITISDPNTFYIGDFNLVGNLTIGPLTGNCEISWGCGEEMYGRIYTCQYTEYALWSVEVRQATNTSKRDMRSAQVNFDLKFTLVHHIGVVNGTLTRRFEGQAHFESARGQNMGTICGGRGSCTYSLHPNTTVLVHQEETENTVKAIWNRSLDGTQIVA
jgi:hypothetical protein